MTRHLIGTALLALLALTSVGCFGHCCRQAQPALRPAPCCPDGRTLPATPVPYDTNYAPVTSPGY